MITYHISIQGSHVLASTAGEVMGHVQSVIEVTSLEVMGHAGRLGTGHVVDIVVDRIQSLDGDFESSRLGVIKNNNAEAFAGVVNVASAADSVENNVVFFTTASHENIDSGNVVGDEAQLGAMALLHSPHGPEIVHHTRKSNGEFDTNEDPGQDKRALVGVLSRDDTVDSVAKIGQVHGGVDEGEQGHGTEKETFPALPSVGIVTVVQASDVAFLDPILGHDGGRRIGKKSSEADIALVLWTEGKRSVSRAEES